MNFNGENEAEEVAVNYSQYTVPDLVTKAKESLDSVLMEYYNVPGNQLGMPMHLAHVASMVGETKEIVEALRKRISEEGEDWQKAINGENNYQEGGKKKRRAGKKSRKTRKQMRK